MFLSRQHTVGIRNRKTVQNPRNSVQKHEHIRNQIKLLKGGLQRVRKGKKLRNQTSLLFPSKTDFLTAENGDKNKRIDVAIPAIGKTVVKITLSLINTS